MFPPVISWLPEMGAGGVVWSQNDRRWVYRPIVDPGGLGSEIAAKSRLALYRTEGPLRHGSEPARPAKKRKDMWLSSGFVDGAL